MNRDNPRNILGDNSADNQFDSSLVNPNANGSMIERQEYMQSQIAGVTAGQIILWGTAPAATNSTTDVVLATLTGYGNDFFNNQFYMQVVKNTNNAGVAPEKQTRKITDYVSATGAFVCDAFGAAIETDDLVVILHESLVAIGSDNADNIIATTNVVPNADGSALERLEWIQAALAGTFGLAAFPVGSPPANDISLAEVLRDIWDSLRNGTGGSEPGTNRSIIDEIKGATINYNSKNYLAVSVDLSSADWNEVATQTVFVVTGLCRLRIIAEITETCTSVATTGTAKLGFTGATANMIAATSIDAMAAGELWIDVSPTEQYGNFSSILFDKISNGIDVGFEIETNAATDGTIVFHCWWEPLNLTGAVAAGTGQALA